MKLLLCFMFVKKNYNNTYHTGSFDRKLVSVIASFPLLHLVLFFFAFSFCGLYGFFFCQLTM
jgi:hypothetical protein